MSLPVVLQPAASQDAEEARTYYESRSERLGFAFLERLKEVLARVASMPEQYGIVKRNVRAARMRQFTYVVYYRVHADRVEVLAVMHGSRDPAAWQARER